MIWECGLRIAEIKKDHRLGVGSWNKSNVQVSEDSDIE
jgi:hypothetical protein